MIYYLRKSLVFELWFPSRIVCAHLYVTMTSWQMERVINKNYRILYKNLMVGINWYKLLILRKIMLQYKSSVKKFKICVSFSFQYIKPFRFYKNFEIQVYQQNKLSRVELIEILLYRYSIQKTEKGITATFGAGFCNIDDYDTCIIFVNLLEDALLPVPYCLPNGTIVMPNGKHILNGTNMIIIIVKLHRFLFTKIG